MPAKLTGGPSAGGSSATSHRNQKHYGRLQSGSNSQAGIHSHAPEICLTKVDDGPDEEGVQIEMHWSENSDDYITTNPLNPRPKPTLSTANRNREEYEASEQTEVADKEKYLRSLAPFIDPYEQVQQVIRSRETSARKVARIASKLGPEEGGSKDASSPARVGGFGVETANYMTRGLTKE